MLSFDCFYLVLVKWYVFNTYAYIEVYVYINLMHGWFNFFMHFHENLIVLIHLIYLFLFRDGKDMDVQSKKDGTLFPWRA